jgi:anti-sigma factor (TIGR02949 family)
MLELLQDYLKHELTADLVGAFEEHLERCAPCFRSAAFERNFVALLSGRIAAGTRCPDALRARVVEALRGSPSA